MKPGGQASAPVSLGRCDPSMVAAFLNDARVQDCLWTGLMEWDLRIEAVALRPRFAAEGGTRPNGWVLQVGLGSGVRLEILGEAGGRRVEKIQMIIKPALAPELLRRTRRHAAERNGDPAGGRIAAEGPTGATA